MSDEMPGQSSVTADPAPSAMAPAPSASWFDALPDGLRANPTLQNFKGKDISAVAESLVESQRLIGGSIRLPNEKDAPADREAKLANIYKQLGRPDAPDGYKINAPAADSGVAWDATRAEGFKSVAHKLGLTQSQAEGLVAYDLQQQSARAIDQNQAYNTCMETLQKDWGAASNEMLGLSRRTAMTYFDEPTMKTLNETGVANNPAFVKAMAKIGRSLMEEGLIVGGREGMGQDGGVAGLQSELDKIMQDASSPYWKSNDPNHDAAVERAKSLRQALLELTTAR